MYRIRIIRAGNTRPYVRSQLTKAQLRVWIDQAMKDELTISWFVETMA